MVVEENSKRVRKILYKLELWLLKILPPLVATLYFINTLFDLFNIHLVFISYIAGTSILSIIFMYISSYAFQFCEYHRLPLHYIVFNNIVCAIEYYIGIPVSTLFLIILHILLFGIMIFLAIYLHQKNKKE